MVGYLTVLSILSLVSAVGIIIRSKRSDNPETSEYVFIGLLIMLFAFVFDYMGTSLAAWTYNESVFMLGSIPIESLILFFSAGVLARFMFVSMESFKIPISYNAIIYVLLLVILIPLILGISEGSFPTMFPLSVVIGLWGILNVSEENRKNILILAAIFIAADWVIESTIISSGGYSFSTDFSMSIVLTHGMFALGLFTVVEKLKDKGLGAIFRLPSRGRRPSVSRSMLKREPVKYDKPKIQRPKKSFRRPMTTGKYLMIMVGVVGAASIAILYVLGYVSLSGLFPHIFPEATTTTSTMETTTTVPATSTTTISTTTTSTTTTTLPECEGNYCVYMSDLSCSNQVITATLVNSGPKAIGIEECGMGGCQTFHIINFKWFVNGNETSKFICSPIAINVGETTSCTYPAGSGTYEVEVRGVSIGNIETGTVSC